MGRLKYILVLVFTLGVLGVKSQGLSLKQADSIATLRYMAGSWRELIGYADTVTAAGIDYPKLHLQVGYAHFSLGNYSGALQQYNKANAFDPHNDTARYFSYLCNLYLNRGPEAYFHAGYLSPGALQREKLSTFGLIQAGLESGVKIPGNKYRYNATYNRVSLSNRLGSKLVLDQSLAYFVQPVRYREFRSTEISDDVQKEYYGKLTYTFLDKLSLIAAYHYFNTGFRQTTYRNNAGLTGIKFTSAYFDLQADMDFSHISGNNYMQYDAKLEIYPLGNLNLYTISESTVKKGLTNNSVFSQLAGVKVTKNLWAEASATFGKLDNYFEYDALYVYNAVDATTFKAGATLYYQLSRHLQVYVNYTAEKKENSIGNDNYNQTSLTGGATWKF